MGGGLGLRRGCFYGNLSLNVKTNCEKVFMALFFSFKCVTKENDNNDNCPKFAAAPTNSASVVPAEGLFT